MRQDIAHDQTEKLAQSFNFHFKQVACYLK